MPTNSVKTIKEMVASLTSKNINHLETPDFFTCLSGITLQVKPGDRLAILGRNGSGKTSLCYLMTKHLYPTHGEISINAKIRAIYSNSTLPFPELSGLDNAKLFARLLYQNLRDNELEEIVIEAFNFSELNQFKNVAIKNYSRGMTSRLILSLITARVAELMIIDEIFDGADQFFMEKFHHRLSSLLKNTNATIFISHDANILRKYCNRAIVIKDGKIAFEGPLEKAIFYYQNCH